MALPLISESEFIRQWLEAKENNKSAAKLAKDLGYCRRDLLARRRRIEQSYGPLPTLGSAPNALKLPTESTYQITHEHEYTVLVFSDAHWWPNVESPATWIMLEILQHIQPDIVVGNGDLLDGASISRHPRIGFDFIPSLADELTTVKTWLDLIREASGKAELIRTIGNHCIRFESFLANNAGQYEGITGTSLDDHFSEWESAWAVTLNDHCIIKHRWRGGRFAAANNTLHAGISTVTGHTHRLKADPYTDYRGTRWGCECGTLASPHGPQFAYTESNPLDWQCGFLILHCDQSGIIGQPERVFVEDNKARWGGKTWRG